MRCIYCKTDTTYPDRKKNGGRCKSCRHAFAFEPKNDRLGVTDPFMQAAIKAVSSDGAAVYTERNLWYEVNRRLARRQFGRRLREAMARILRRPLRARPVVDAATFRARYLEPWTGTHGEAAGLLPPPERSLPAAPRTPSPDVTAFSFDRALVTDRAETAALLIANNFHFEHNCAILGADGYPPDIFATVMAMLRRNPELTVFALHDATADGCMLPARLREQGWFPDPSVRMIDLGLRPRQVEQLRLMRQDRPARALTEEEQRTLPLDDAAWFATGEGAELAAVRPARLMRTVFQGFALAGRPQGGAAADDGLFIWWHAGSADVYAADSFG